MNRIQAAIALPQSSVSAAKKEAGTAARHPANLYSTDVGHLTASSVRKASLMWSYACNSMWRNAGTPSLTNRKDILTSELCCNSSKVMRPIPLRLTVGALGCAIPNIERERATDVLKLCMICARPTQLRNPCKHAITSRAASERSAKGELVRLGGPRQNARCPRCKGKVEMSGSSKVEMSAF
jgi:hypothetical protein